MQTKQPNRIISRVSIFCLVFAFFMLHFTGPSYATVPNNILVVVQIGNPVTMDPHVTLDGDSILPWRGPYETLLNVKKDTYELTPGLAKGWEISSDGLEYTFHLHEGIKFHDGTPFTAEAAKFTLDRSMALGKGGAYMLEPVKEINAVDDYTLQIKLKYQSRSFLGVMVGICSPSSAINPKVVKAHEIISEKDGKKVSDWGQKYLFNHMPGTGPYKLVRWDQGQQIILEKHEDYWRGWSGPHFDRIIIRYVEEVATASLMLQRGEADIVIGLTDQMITDLAEMKDKGVVVYQHPSVMTHYFGLPCAKGPTADVRVRKAIAHAFPYERFIKKNLKGYAYPMKGFLPRAFPGYNPDIPKYHYDMDKAKKLLTEAGYPNGGFTLKLVWDTGYDWKRPVAETMQESLKKLGIKLTIQELTSPATMSLLGNPETFDYAYPVVWWPAMPTPTDYFWSLLHKDAISAAGFNFPKYDNAEINERIYKIETIVDEKEWYDNIARIQEIVYEEVPYLTLYETDFRIPMRQNLKGFIYNGLYINTLDFYNMWKE